MDDEVLKFAMAAVRSIHSVPADHVLVAVEAGPRAVSLYERDRNGAPVAEYCVLGIWGDGSGAGAKPIKYGELLTPSQEEKLGEIWKDWHSKFEKSPPSGFERLYLVPRLDDMPEMFEFKTPNNLHGNVRQEMQAIFHRLEDRFESLGYLLVMSSGEDNPDWGLAVVPHRSRVF